MLQSAWNPYGTLHHTTQHMVVTHRSWLCILPSNIRNFKNPVPRLNSALKHSSLFCDNAYCAGCAVLPGSLSGPGLSLHLPHAPAVAPWLAAAGPHPLAGGGAGGGTGGGSTSSSCGGAMGWLPAGRLGLGATGSHGHGPHSSHPAPVPPAQCAGMPLLSHAESCWLCQPHAAGPPALHVHDGAAAAGMTMTKRLASFKRCPRLASLDVHPSRGVQQDSSDSLQILAMLFHPAVVQLLPHGASLSVLQNFLPGMLQHGCLPRV